jgi:hypothetical protein
MTRLGAPGARAARQPAGLVKPHGEVLDVGAGRDLAVREFDRGRLG